MITGTETEVRGIPPKRRRLMDMILFLGGLKDESTVSPARVSQEVEALRKTLEPLIDKIVAFPNLYYEEFLRSIERSGLVHDLRNREFLTKAIAGFEQAISVSQSAHIQKLIELLKFQLEQKDNVEAIQSVSEMSIDLSRILTETESVIQQIESSLSELENSAKRVGADSETELVGIVDELHEIADIADPSEALERIQKLAARLRYGPLLRTSAQIKRGRREGRIADERFGLLVRNNALTELRRAIMLFVLDRIGARTIRQMSNLLRVPPETLQREILSMIQRGEVEILGHEDRAVVFGRVLSSIPSTTLVTRRVLSQLQSAQKTLQEPERQALDQMVRKLQVICERMQLLGQYDENSLSASVNKLRELADLVTQSAMKSMSSESAEDLRLLVSAGLEAFAKFNLKLALEKGPSLVSGSNVYGQKLTKEQYEKILDTYLSNEFERGLLLVLIREHGPSTAKELAQLSKIPQDRVFRHLLKMKRDELLTTVGESHGYVIYDVPRTPSEAEIVIKLVSEVAFPMMSAVSNIGKVIVSLGPENVGQLATDLETVSKARDRLSKARVGGVVIGDALLSDIEPTLKSAVAAAYQTRSHIPSTRPKISVNDLKEIDVPTVMDEYRNMMGYAPLIGFGTVKWDYRRCIGCKTCELSCPEDAIYLRPEVDVARFFEISEDDIKKLPANKALLYRVVRGLAVTKSSETVRFDSDKPGFGTVTTDLWLCVACRTCVRKCPGPEKGALDIELKWNLPEVVNHLLAEGARS
ncbi:MAG: 4Fe-4S dicluster domain-containing protein [Candidatus Thorarchaeota archaeon]